jgi:hypothetical protein
MREVGQRPEPRRLDQRTFGLEGGIDDIIGELLALSKL